MIVMMELEVVRREAAFSSVFFHWQRNVKRCLMHTKEQHIVDEQRRFYPNRRRKSRTITFQSRILSLMLFSLIRFAAFSSFYPFRSIFPIIFVPHTPYSLLYMRTSQSNGITLMDNKNELNKKKTRMQWKKKRNREIMANRSARWNTMNGPTYSHTHTIGCWAMAGNSGNNKPKLIFAREHETNNCIKFTTHIPTE